MIIVHERLCTDTLPAIKCRPYPDEHVFCNSTAFRDSRQS
jgi:hypothetical protein